MSEGGFPSLGVRLTAEGAETAKQAVRDFGTTIRDTGKQAETSSESFKKMDLNFKDLSRSAFGFGLAISGTVIGFSRLEKSTQNIAKEKVALARAENQLITLTLRLNKLQESGKATQDQLTLATRRVEVARQNLTTHTKDLDIAESNLRDSYIIFATSVIPSVIFAYSGLRSALQGVTREIVTNRLAMIFLKGTAMETSPAIAGITVASSAYTLAAIRATFATQGFAAGIKSLWASIGPIGWAIIGISTAITLYETNLFGAKDAVDSFLGINKQIPVVADEAGSAIDDLTFALQEQKRGFDDWFKPSQFFVDQMFGIKTQAEAAASAVNNLSSEVAGLRSQFSGGGPGGVQGVGLGHGTTQVAQLNLKNLNTGSGTPSMFPDIALGTKFDIERESLNMKELTSKEKLLTLVAKEVQFTSELNSQIQEVLKLRDRELALMLLRKTFSEEFNASEERLANLQLEKLLAQERAEDRKKKKKEDTIKVMEYEVRLLDEIKKKRRIINDETIKGILTLHDIEEVAKRLQKLGKDTDFFGLTGIFNNLTGKQYSLGIEGASLNNLIYQFQLLENEKNPAEQARKQRLLMNQLNTQMMNISGAFNLTSSPAFLNNNFGQAAFDQGLFRSRIPIPRKITLGGGIGKALDAEAKRRAGEKQVATPQVILQMAAERDRLANTDPTTILGIVINSMFSGPLKRGQASALSKTAGETLNRMGGGAELKPVAEAQKRGLLTSADISNFRDDNGYIDPYGVIAYATQLLEFDNISKEEKKRAEAQAAIDAAIAEKARINAERSSLVGGFQSVLQRESAYRAFLASGGMISTGGTTAGALSPDVIRAIENAVAAIMAGADYKNYNSLLSDIKLR